MLQTFFWRPCDYAPISAIQFGLSNYVTDYLWANMLYLFTMFLMKTNSCALKQPNF